MDFHGMRLNNIRRDNNIRRVKTGFQIILHIIYIMLYNCIFREYTNIDVQKHLPPSLLISLIDQQLLSLWDKTCT